MKKEELDSGGLVQMVMFVAVALTIIVTITVTVVTSGF